MINWLYKFGGRVEYLKSKYSKMLSSVFDKAKPEDLQGALNKELGHFQHYYNFPVKYLEWAFYQSILYYKDLFSAVPDAYRFDNSNAEFKLFPFWGWNLIEQVDDYLVRGNGKIQSLTTTPAEVKSLSDAWHKKISEIGNTKYKTNKVISVLSNGWRLVEVGEKDAGTEGKLMGHCVGSYCKDIRSGESIIFSLRDSENMPHFTIEVNPQFVNTYQPGIVEGTGVWVISQIKGRQDEPNPEYAELIEESLNAIGKIKPITFDSIGAIDYRSNQPDITDRTFRYEMMSNQPNVKHDFKDIKFYNLALEMSGVKLSKEQLFDYYKTFDYRATEASKIIYSSNDEMLSWMLKKYPQNLIDFLNKKLPRFIDNDVRNEILNAIDAIKQNDYYRLGGVIYDQLLMYCSDLIVNWNKLAIEFFVDDYYDSALALYKRLKLQEVNGGRLNSDQIDAFDEMMNVINIYKINTKPDNLAVEKSVGVPQRNNQEVTASVECNQFPMAGGIISGLRVREDVPNTSSIGASLEEYEVMPGIREVSMSAFGDVGVPQFYSIAEKKRTYQLAEAIKNNGEINPLIVVVDNEGPYILEGAHRYDALKLLGIKSFPALVVMDRSELVDKVAGLKIAQVYNLWLDGVIKCRVVPHSEFESEKFRLVEMENGNRVMVGKWRLKSEPINKYKSEMDDLLCNFCGKTGSELGWCEYCGGERS